MDLSISKKVEDKLPQRFLFLLFPGLLQGVLAILVLPFATLILTPADYGIYAVVIAFTGLLAAIASMGSSFIMANRFRPEVSTENCKLVSTLFIAVTGAGLLFAMISVVVFVLNKPSFDFFKALPLICLLFAMVDMVASGAWGIANSIAVLSRKVRLFAFFTVIRAIATPVAVLSTLFLLNISGPTALFSGALAGGVVFAIGALIIAWNYLRPVFSLQILAEIVRSGGLLGLANLAESVHRLLERSVITSNLNLSATGIWTHSQLYSNMLMMGVRPAIQAAWPRLCEEARQQPALFPKGRYLSQIIGLGIATAATIFALIGPEFVEILTNGRFTESAPYAAMLIAILGLKFSGRPQHAMIVANGHYSLAALINGLSAFGGMILVVVFVPVWGLVGAVAALSIYAVIYLGLLYYHSSKINRTKVHDSSAIAGFVLTLATLYVMDISQPEFKLRFIVALLVFLVGCLVALVIVHRSGYLASIFSGNVRDSG